MFQPYWHQPDQNVGAVFVTSQEQRDELDARNWPEGMSAEELALEAEHAAEIEAAVKEATAQAVASVKAKHEEKPKNKGGRPKKAE